MLPPGILESTFNEALNERLMCDLSVEDTEWKPAPDRFSVAEVLAHLSHSEGHCYRTRVDRFVSEELPEFEPDDAQMYLELYRNANAEDAFDHFEEQHETNVEYLRTLPRSAGERRADGVSCSTLFETRAGDGNQKFPSPVLPSQPKSRGSKKLLRQI